jgi:hypothetical protein
MLGSWFVVAFSLVFQYIHLGLVWLSWVASLRGVALIMQQEIKGGGGEQIRKGDFFR